MIVQDEMRNSEWVCVLKLGEGLRVDADNMFLQAPDRKPCIDLRSKISMEQPIAFRFEMLFGLAFAWMTTKLARRIYLHRMETSATVNFIRDRSYKIRRAVEAINPVPHPSHHQAIRVIREEVDRIELVLTEIVPR